MPMQNIPWWLTDMMAVIFKPHDLLTTLFIFTGRYACIAFHNIQ